MALFLIACTFDEGLNIDDFAVIEAQDALEVVVLTRLNYEEFAAFFEVSVFYDWLRGQPHSQTITSHQQRLLLVKEFKKWFLQLSDEEALERINQTHVDGDSAARLSIYEIIRFYEAS